MHFQPFRAPGATRHWLQFWVLLLLVPACFALSMMPVTVAAVAITLTFGVPLAMWLGLHVHSASDFRRRAPRGIRFATGVSVTALGLIGLFLFSTALALAAVAAYVVTVALTTWAGSHPRAVAGPTAVPTPETPTDDIDEPELPEIVVLTLDEVREMTDAELCHAWRHSFVSLERARGAHQARPGRPDPTAAARRGRDTSSRRFARLAQLRGARRRWPRPVHRRQRSSRGGLNR